MMKVGDRVSFNRSKGTIIGIIDLYTIVEFDVPYAGFKVLGLDSYCLVGDSKMKVGDRVQYNGLKGKLVKQCGDDWLIELDESVSGISTIAARKSSIESLENRYYNPALCYNLLFKHGLLTVSNKIEGVAIPCTDEQFQVLKRIMGRNWQQD